MTVPIFQIDAFTNRRFAGNPAAVMILEAYPDDARLADVAAENNLAETAFLVPQGGDWRLRWFTPTVEVPLCGHATLASAWVVLNRLRPGDEAVRFHTLSGVLTVRRAGDGFRMDFPSRPMAPVAASPDLADALGAAPSEVLKDDRNLMAVFPGAQDVRDLAPDIPAVARLGGMGVIATAPGDQGYDCVSRYFAPASGIAEDPVTGGAHCAIAPYWSERLGKAEIFAFQASPRGGEIRCRLAGERVELEGQAVFYMEGQAEI